MRTVTREVDATVLALFTVRAYDDITEIVMVTRATVTGPATREVFCAWVEDPDGRNTRQIGGRSHDNATDAMNAALSHCGWGMVPTDDEDSAVVWARA